MFAPEFLRGLCRLPVSGLSHRASSVISPSHSCISSFSDNPGKRQPQSSRRSPNTSHRPSSRDKDPFGYTFSRPFRRVEPLDGPNVIFEERFHLDMDEKTIPAAKPMEFPQQNFDYFLVLDFEATCDKPTTPVPQEIIEFPVVKVDARTMQPVAVFHQYVQPTVNPHLSPFCTKLTGIIQDMVDGQPSLDAVLRLFDEWLQKEGLSDPNVRFSFVTCGDWDLGEMLPQQAKHFRLPLPAYFDNWINLKHAFSESLGHYPRSLMLMLESLGIKHTGRAHSGIDDCKNIVNIVRGLAQRGQIFHTTGQAKNATTASRINRPR